MPLGRRSGVVGLWLASMLAGSAFGCGSQPAPPSAVSELSGRTLLLPLRFGWVSSGRPSGALPSAIALGGKAAGRVLLYFEFDELKETRRMLRGELLLTASGTSGDQVEVELAGSDAARGELRAWSEQPQPEAPRLAARLVAQPTAQRLDVTAILRAQNKPGQALRLQLRAEPQPGAPLLLETGAAGGSQPRLEVYWE